LLKTSGLRSYKAYHGEEEALNAQKTAEALFEKGASTDNMPTTEVASGELSNGINIMTCF